MSASGVVDFSDAIAIALVTSSMIKGANDPRWYVRHGWIVGALVFYLGRVAENALLEQAAIKLAEGNGGTLPQGYEMFQPYLPPSYTGQQKPNVSPTTPQLPRSTPGVIT